MNGMSRSPLERCAYILEERLADAPALPPAYAQCLKDALKYVRRADEAVRAADMILKGGVK